MTLSPPRGSTNGFARVLAALTLAVILINGFVAGIVFLFLHQSRIEAYDHAIVTANNIGKILDQTVSGMIAKTDLGLHAIIDQLIGEHIEVGDQRHILGILDLQDQRVRDVLGFRLFAPDGRLAYAVHNVRDGSASIGDRPYFQRLARGERGLVLSSPQVERVSGEWNITLARRLEAGDGRFIGVVSASIGIDHLSEMLASLDLGSHAIVAIYNTDPAPRMVVRYPKESMGQSLIGTAILSHELSGFIASGRDADQYDYISPFDGMRRLGSARHIPGYPLYLVVGLAEADFLVGWYKERRRLLGLTFAVLVVTLLAAHQVYRGWRQRAKALADLEDSNIRLQREERSLGRAQHIAGLGSLEVDLVAGTLLCSDQACRIIGGKPASDPDPLGGFLAAVHADDRERVGIALAAALNDGRAREFECRIVRPGGEVRWLTCGWQAERDAGGRAICAIATIQDISERKAAEQEIARYRDHLESLVTERTLALTKANQAAKAALVAKSRFLAAASHDLRQPTHALRLLLSAIEAETREADDLERLDLVVEARQATRRLSDLLDSLLDVSRLEAGVVEPVFSVWALAPLLFELETQFRVVASSQDVRLTIVDSSAAVHSDAVLVNRILSNLVSNAIKFAPGGVVLVGCRRRAGEVEIQVWDNGIGIAPEMVEAIFDEFRQIGNDARQNEKGLGLGLAIVKRIAGLLGARITVRSWPGRGSMFSVRLPTARGHMTSPPVARGPVPDRKGWDEEGLGYVAVVDDDLQVLGATAAFLRPHCARIDTFASAADALRTLCAGDKDVAAEPPDALVVDYRLPGEVSGLELIDEIRLTVGTAVPAILITGERLLPHLGEREQVSVMGKPVTPSAIIDVLQSFRNGQHVQ